MQTSQSRNFQKFLSVIKMVQNAGKTVTSYLRWTQTVHCIVSKQVEPVIISDTLYTGCAALSLTVNECSILYFWQKQAWIWSIRFDASSVDSLKLLWSTMWDATQQPKWLSDAYVLRPTILRQRRWNVRTFSMWTTINNYSHPYKTLLHLQETKNFY